MYDVIVVGAGPAGAYAARLCAQMDMKVLLLEKKRLPRDKPCGGAVGTTGLRMLGDGCKDLIKDTSSEARLFLDFDEVATIKRKVNYFDRTGLDMRLVEMAKQEGVTVIDGASVTNLGFAYDGLYAFTEKGFYVAEMAIGADGANSVVRDSSKLNRFRQRPDRLLTSVFELDGTAGPASRLLTALREGRCYHTYFFKGFTGLGWAFPKGNKVNIGVGGSVRHGKCLRSMLRMILSTTGLDEHVVANAKWHMVPCRPLSRIYSDQVMLVGDAAGLANPLTGAGIETGLVSAELAASVARSAWSKEDYSGQVLGEYQRKCDRLMTRLKHRARILDILDFFVKRNLDSTISNRFVLGHFAQLAEIG